MNEQTYQQLLKKTIPWRVGKRRMELDLPFDVFSSHQLDAGTAFLLRQMDAANRPCGRTLDVGCGYGPIGLWAAIQGNADCLGIDRDVLAVEFARRNAEKNGIDNVRFEPGLPYDDVAAASFDTVVTNIPAKAGPGVQRLFLLGAADCLAPGGVAWVVAVAPLASIMDEILATSAVRVLSREGCSGHIVYSYVFVDRVSLPAAPYARGRQTFRHGMTAYVLDGRHGLAEFDSLSFGTECAFKILDRLPPPPTRVGVRDPGHGHVAAFLALRDPKLDLHLESRDLLGLQTTTHTLHINSCHLNPSRRLGMDSTLGTDVPLDLVVSPVNKALPLEFQGMMVNQWLKNQPGLRVVLHGPANLLDRLTGAIQLPGMESALRVKKRGFAAVALRARGR